MQTGPLGKMTKIVLAGIGLLAVGWPAGSRN
jgi:hypothetical protein